MKYSQTREELFLKLVNRKEPRAQGNKGICVYSHNVNGGCAIGCDIRQSLALKLDSFELGHDTGVNNPDVFNSLPNRLRKMGQMFLADLQHLHDCHLGESTFNEKANFIITEYNLKLDKIK